MALSKIDVANMVTGATPVANGGTALTSGFKNGVDPRPLSKPIIVNGDMAVAQRGTSVTGHNAVSYTTVDRFKTVCEVGTYTVIQESLTSGAAYLAGFRNALRLDCTTAETSAGSAGDQTTVEQRIEGFNLSAFKKGTSSAEKYTLAFWVKANKTGSNLQVNLRDNTNDRQIGGTYSIASADTWEHKVINFAADTSGPFADVSTAELLIEWFLDGGGNYSGGAVPTAWEAKANSDRNVTNFDLAGNTANDWAITGVQLEVGEFSSTTLPPFQFEDFGDNLQRCFRYFEKRCNVTEAIITPAQCVSGTKAMAGLHCTEKRAVPSVTLGACILITATNGSAGSVTSTSIGAFSSTGGRFDANIGSSNLTAGNVTYFQPNSTTDGVTFDAEL